MVLSNRRNDITNIPWAGGGGGREMEGKRAGRKEGRKESRGEGKSDGAAELKCHLAQISKVAKTRRQKHEWSVLRPKSERLHRILQW